MRVLGVIVLGGLSVAFVVGGRACASKFNKVGSDVQASDSVEDEAASVWVGN